ncbi:MAG TPA: linear amide C-N hydrolase [Alphaproteobacteria bacterium]|nr:linear amide C-N hydrolase [Alphaproteobacteria bacterium]
MKIFMSAFVIATSFSSHLSACSDVFINQGTYHIEARTLDFLVNIAFQDKMGFVGEENTTDVVLDAEKIPSSQLTSWKNKYGYFGRTAFGQNIIDGMNTEGLSVSILYMPGSKYPIYDNKDKKQVLSVYDIASYILSQARTVPEGIKLIRSRQIIESAVKVKDGYFVKDIPIHYVMRDKKGNSAVIEFIDGQVKIYENAGDVLTNSPPLDWQIQNASYYDSLLAGNKHANKKFSKTFHNYDEIYKTISHVGEANLMGLPGDYTPPSRFVRAKVLLNNFPAPTNRQVALYQASSLNDSLLVPAVKGAAPTLWISIKDLDDNVYYVKNIVLYQENRNLFPMPITSGYTTYDLKSIDFNIAGPLQTKIKVEPTNPKEIKEIVSADSIKIAGVIQ